MDRDDQLICDKNGNSHNCGFECSVFLSGLCTYQEELKVSDVLDHFHLKEEAIEIIQSYFDEPEIISKLEKEIKEDKK